MPPHLTLVPAAQQAAVLAAITNVGDYDNDDETKRRHKWQLISGEWAWSCACDPCKEKNLSCLVGRGKVCVDCGGKKCGAGRHCEYDEVARFTVSSGLAFARI